MENSSHWHPWFFDLPCYLWHMTTAYLVTWDRTKPELDYNNPGFGPECDQTYNYTVSRVENAKW
jgi:hypothetical protein